jgi:hypothetical protein
LTHRCWIYISLRRVFSIFSYFQKNIFCRYDIQWRVAV